MQQEMKDRAKWMERENKSIEASEPNASITRATPNKQLKNQVTYDYRTPTTAMYVQRMSLHLNDGPDCSNSDFIVNWKHVTTPSL